MISTLSPRQIPASVWSSARNLWLASLGAIATTSKSSSQLFDDLVSRGRKVENRGQRRLEATMETAGNEAESLLEKMSAAIERQVAANLKKAEVPTRDDVIALADRVERLTRLVEKMETKPETNSETPARSPADERKVYHVSAHEDGWKVQAEGAERASRVTTTKAEAVDAARELGQSQEPSRVVIHRLDGTIQTHHSYGELDEDDA